MLRPISCLWSRSSWSIERRPPSLSRIARTPRENSMYCATSSNRFGVNVLTMSRLSHCSRKSLSSQVNKIRTSSKSFAATMKSWLKNEHTNSIQLDWTTNRGRRVWSDTAVKWNLSSTSLKAYSKRGTLCWGNLRANWRKRIAVFSHSRILWRQSRLNLKGSLISFKQPFRVAKLRWVVVTGQSYSTAISSLLLARRPFRRVRINSLLYGSISRQLWTRILS